MATALITGGTSGIGASFAKALAERGDNLILVARDADRLTRTATELSHRYGVEVETLPADLGIDADVRRVAERLEDAARPVDLLVNNAGFGVHSKLTDPDTSKHEQAIAVMIKAVLILGGAGGRAMRERGHGQIINVGSTAAFVTMGHYSAIKSWVTSYSEGLSNELRGTGVAVTALLPGWVRTEFHQRAEIKTSSLPAFLWLESDRLVADCLADVARGKVLSIPAKRYKVMMTIMRHLPRTAVRAVSAKLTSTRR